MTLALQIALVIVGAAFTFADVPVVGGLFVVGAAGWAVYESTRWP